MIPSFGYVDPPLHTRGARFAQLRAALLASILKKKRNVLTLEEAVRRMTLLPASRIGLTDRGFLNEGMAADIVMFDENTIAETATREEPRLLCDGVEAVIVNGSVVYREKKAVGNLPGKYLRKGRI